jgi:hypothetical protein
MTKRVYLFSGLNASYNGFWDCQESPLELGVYIQPEESTEVEPPIFDASTHSCVWSGSEWLLTELPKLNSYIAPNLTVLSNNDATPTVV